MPLPMYMRGVLHQQNPAAKAWLPARAAQHCQQVHSEPSCRRKVSAMQAYTRTCSCQAGQHLKSDQSGRGK